MSDGGMATGEKFQRWRRFGSKVFSEVNVPLEAFPDLFLMEAMTGFFGCAFCAYWFIQIGQDHPTIVPVLWRFATAISAIFFLLAVISVLSVMNIPFTDDFAAKVRNSSSVGDDEKQKLAIQVRMLIAAFSAIYAIDCAFLIWFSGGARSPFVPFYVMTFTLTMANTRVPRWFGLVLIYYLAVISISCYAAAWYPPPIAPPLWNSILESEFQTGTHWVFIALSLAVPTLSSYAVEYRSRRRREAEPTK